MRDIEGKQGPVVNTEVDGKRNVTLRIGVFFDGTGNNRLNSLNDGTALSNVARLYELYRHQASTPLASGQTSVSLSIYIDGIGTVAGASDSLLSKVTGRYGAGVLARAQQAPVAIIEAIGHWCQMNPAAAIQKIELDIFGFSRGAAAARHFANDIDKGAASRLAKRWPAHASRQLHGLDWSSCLAINFIGLFDTVAAIVSVLEGNFSPANVDYGDLELGLRPAIARKIVHLVARDEHRKNFPLTQAFEDIVVPGAHADVGGGYSPQVHEQLLLSRPVSSVEARTLSNEEARSHREVLAQYARNQAYWQLFKVKVEVRTESTDLPFVPSHGSVAKKQVLSYIRGERTVAGDLSLVYLRIMHTLAANHGVPFIALDEQRFAVPSALQAIASKLTAYATGEQPDAGLDAEEEALLFERYIHLSSDWSVAGAVREGVTALYVNRPHESGQRSVFPNP
ncbi:type IV secretion protein Rhs [Pseudomonas alkylphenolica]|uniref:Type IV secretion protein Rhs n=1 Tax=Pseudomonas alkylphenolica TaxID=237609 RepID=A0A443ZJZ9_9PSED|nr:DUF2235 domain-containing protein [Pseudomonas alkylphenolica]RWU19269.1 type IV secretion protein Rhs [Pseudomonas alkylphenolica]